MGSRCRYSLRWKWLMMCIHCQLAMIIIDHLSTVISLIKQVVPVNCHRAPYVTLMEALAHDQVTAKFKCVIRVVVVLPCQPEMVRSLAGIYRMRLTLENATARIHACVFAEDGEILFDGYLDTDSLSKKLNKLLGVIEGGATSDKRNSPWVSVS